MLRVQARLGNGNASQSGLFVSLLSKNPIESAIAWD
jgi:hypothetical protein